jgi:hypothetical protein
VIHKALIIHREVRSLFSTLLEPGSPLKGRRAVNFVSLRSVSLAACGPLLRLKVLVLMMTLPCLFDTYP